MHKKCDTRAFQIFSNTKDWFSLPIKVLNSLKDKIPECADDDSFEAYFYVTSGTYEAKKHKDSFRAAIRLTEEEREHVKFYRRGSALIITAKKKKDGTSWLPSLAEKFEVKDFDPTKRPENNKLFERLCKQTGESPFIGGQYGHALFTKETQKDWFKAAENSSTSVFYWHRERGDDRGVLGAYTNLRYAIIALGMSEDLECSLGTEGGSKEPARKIVIIKEKTPGAFQELIKFFKDEAEKKDYPSDITAKEFVDGIKMNEELYRHYSKRGAGRPCKAGVSNSHAGVGASAASADASVAGHKRSRGHSKITDAHAGADAPAARVSEGKEVDVAEFLKLVEAVAGSGAEEDGGARFASFKGDGINDAAIVDGVGARGRGRKSSILSLLDDSDLELPYSGGSVGPRSGTAISRWPSSTDAPVALPGGAGSHAATAAVPPSMGSAPGLFSLPGMERRRANLGRAASIRSLLAADSVGLEAPASLPRMAAMLGSAAPIAASAATSSEAFGARSGVSSLSEERYQQRTSSRARTATDVGPSLPTSQGLMPFYSAGAEETSVRLASAQSQYSATLSSDVPGALPAPLPPLRSGSHSGGTGTPNYNIIEEAGAERGGDDFGLPAATKPN